MFRVVGQIGAASLRDFFNRKNPLDQISSMISSTPLAMTDDPDSLSPSPIVFAAGSQVFLRINLLDEALSVNGQKSRIERMMSIELKGGLSFMMRSLLLFRISKRKARGRRRAIENRFGKRLSQEKQVSRDSSNRRYDLIQIASRRESTELNVNLMISGLIKL